MENTFSLNGGIISYLTQNNIQFDGSDYSTGQPEGQDDQILTWNSNKLGRQPSEAELKSAYDVYLLKQMESDARAKRDSLLAASDWTQVVDSPVDKETWSVYRQELRDVPSQKGFPTDIVWPIEPK